MKRIRPREDVRSSEVTSSILGQGLFVLASVGGKLTAEYVRLTGTTQPYLAYSSETILPAQTTNFHRLVANSHMGVGPRFLTFPINETGHLTLKWGLPTQSPTLIVLDGLNADLPAEVEDLAVPPVTAGNVMQVDIDYTRTPVPEEEDPQPGYEYTWTVQAFMGDQLVFSTGEFLSGSKFPVFPTLMSPYSGEYSFEQLTDGVVSAHETYHQRKLVFFDEPQSVTVNPGQPIELRNSFGWDDGTPLESANWSVNVFTVNGELVRSTDGFSSATFQGPPPPDGTVVAPVNVRWDPFTNVLAKGTSNLDTPIELIPAGSTKALDLRARASGSAPQSNVFVYGIGASANTAFVVPSTGRRDRYGATVKGNVPGTRTIYIENERVSSDTFEPGVTNVTFEANILANNYDKRQVDWLLEVVKDDPSQQVVRTYEPTDFEIVLHQVVNGAAAKRQWDGRDQTGEIAPSGRYAFRLTARAAEIGAPLPPEPTPTPSVGSSPAPQPSPSIDIVPTKVRQRFHHSADPGTIAQATVSLDVTIEPRLPEIVRIEATGVIPLLDDNGQPISPLYWNGEDGTSQPIAAVPSATSADVAASRVAGLAVSSATSFETSKLNLTLRRPVGAAPGTSATFTYQGRIPKFGKTDTDKDFDLVVRNFDAPFNSGETSINVTGVPLFTTGQVRAEKITFYGKKSDSSSEFKKAALAILRDDPHAVPEPQKIYLPLAAPLKPFAGLAGDHIPDHVMQRACTYANGETDPNKVRERLTKGLFGWLCWKHGAKYSPDLSAFGTIGVDVLNLDYFMRKKTDQDCQATSSFLEIHCSALGVEMRLQKVEPIQRNGFFPTRRALGWGKAWGPQPAGADPNFPDFKPAPTLNEDLFQSFSFGMHQFCVFSEQVHETSFGVLTQPGYLYNGNVTLTDYYQRELPRSPGALRLEGGLFDTVHIVP